MSRTRVPNKVQWGLKDILKEAADISPTWQRAMKRAKNQLDTATVSDLAIIQNHLATIERKANDALRGEYNDCSCS